MIQRPFENRAKGLAPYAVEGIAVIESFYCYLLALVLLPLGLRAPLLGQEANPGRLETTDCGYFKVFANKSVSFSKARSAWGWL